MNHELQKQIIIWMCDNRSTWQIVNSCHKHFYQYIYDDSGDYIIGGKQVSDFINKVYDILKQD